MTVTVHMVAALAVVGGCGRVWFDPLHDGTPGSDAAEIAVDGQLVIDAPVLQLDSGQCPAAYMPAGQSCYRLSLVRAPTWLDAELSCEADAVGAHLVTVDDAAEANLLASTFSVDDYWAGVTDRIDEDSYRNVTGEPAPYLEWEGGDPGSQDCAQFDGVVFHQSDCDTDDEYLCEFDGRMAAAGAY